MADKDPIERRITEEALEVSAETVREMIDPNFQSTELATRVVQTPPYTPQEFNEIIAGGNIEVADKMRFAATVALLQSTGAQMIAGMPFEHGTAAHKWIEVMQMSAKIAVETMKKIMWRQRQQLRRSRLN